MKPGKTSSNIAFTPIWNAEQQESFDEETINIGGSQEYKVESAFSENATSEIQDPAPTVHLRAPKRQEREIDSKLSGRNDKLSEQETQVVDWAREDNNEDLISSGP